MIVPEMFVSNSDTVWLVAARPKNCKVGSLVMKSVLLTPLSLEIDVMEVEEIDEILPAESVPLTVTVLLAGIPLGGKVPDVGVAVPVSTDQVPPACTVVV